MKDLSKENDSKKFRILFLITSFCQSMSNNIFGANGIFMTSFFLHINATVTHIGLFGATINFTNILQIFAIRITHKLKSRKKSVVILTILYYSFISLIIIIPKIFTDKYVVSLVLLVFVLGNAFRALRASGIIDWNNFFVPNETKGKYYSTKNLLANLVYIILSLGVGKLLDTYVNNYLVFFLIFMLGLVFAVIEIMAYSKVKDCNDDLIDIKKITFKEMFTKPLKNKAYVSFMIFSLTWSFTRSLATPYLTYYSKTELALGFTYIALIGSITCLIKIIIANPWGSLGDKYGFRIVLVYAGVLFSLANTMWAFITPNSIYLYIPTIILTGIFMIGTNICVFNINIELAPIKERLLFMGFNGTLTGVFAFIGPNIASYIVNRFSDINLVIMNSVINGYQIVFFASGILQMIPVIWFYNYLKKNNLGTSNKKEIIK